jgi:hypothetical protein
MPKDETPRRIPARPGNVDEAARKRNDPEGSVNAIAVLVA